MARREIEVLDDKVVANVYVRSEIYYEELILTKDVFIECYEKWIKGKEKTNEH